MHRLRWIQQVQGVVVAAKCHLLPAEWKTSLQSFSYLLLKQWLYFSPPGRRWTASTTGELHPYEEFGTAFQSAAVLVKEQLSVGRWSQPAAWQVNGKQHGRQLAQQGASLQNRTCWILLSFEFKRSHTLLSTQVMLTDTVLPLQQKAPSAPSEILQTDLTRDRVWHTTLGKLLSPVLGEYKWCMEVWWPGNVFWLYWAEKFGPA